MKKIFFPFVLGVVYEHDVRFRAEVPALKIVSMPKRNNVSMCLHR